MMRIPVHIKHFHRGVILTSCVYGEMPKLMRLKFISVLSKRNMPLNLQYLWLQKL